MFKERNTVYLSLKEVKREDYIINRFRKLIELLETEWNRDHKQAIILFTKDDEEKHKHLNEAM